MDDAIDQEDFEFRALFDCPMAKFDWDHCDMPCSCDQEYTWGEKSYRIVEIELETDDDRNTV